jgi:hypothetical protein
LLAVIGQDFLDRGLEAIAAVLGLLIGAQQLQPTRFEQRQHRGTAASMWLRQK